MTKTEDLHISQVSYMKILNVLPSGDIPPNPSELLMDEKRFDSLFQRY